MGLTEFAFMGNKKPKYVQMIDSEITTFWNLFFSLFS